MNPIISMLNQQNPLFALYNAMRSSGNTMGALSQMAMQDERMQQVINVINQNGGVQQAVYAEAQRRNIDPNNALNQAQQLIQSFNMK